MHSCYWKGHFVYFSGGDCVLPLPTLPFLTSQVVPVGGQPFQTVSRPLVFNQRLFDFMHCFTFTASVLLMARQGWKQPGAYVKIVPARGRVQCVPGVQDITSKTQTHKRSYTNTHAHIHKSRPKYCTLLAYLGRPCPAVDLNMHDSPRIPCSAASVPSVRWPTHKTMEKQASHLNTLPAYPVIDDKYLAMKGHYNLENSRM